MRTKIKILSSLVIVLVLLGRCKDKYVSPYHPPSAGYLVVEGFIAGNAPTTVTLSRVVALPGDSSIPPEIHAKVQVEGTDNSIFPLDETSAGVYTANTLGLNPAVRYRLRITTRDSKVYLSDATPYRITPAVDSISWKQTPDGVTIYANTHDPANATHYYLWDFTETWEYNSAEYSSTKYRPFGYAVRGFDTVTRREDSEYIYTCWRTRNSTPLLLGSSVKLGKDVIYLQKLQYFPTASQELSVKYSILVRQYALTDSAYNFLSLMKSNTESLGSIFDAQPSELRGNIHSLTDPQETVVGYISAGTIQQQRIFISLFQLNNWGYRFECEQKDTVVAPNLIGKFFADGQWVPIDRVYNMSGFIGWSANARSCIDCTVQGGTTIKPSFWQ